MIEIRINNEKNAYNVYHLVKAFYPQEEIHSVVDEKASHFVKIISQNLDLSFSEMPRPILDKELYLALSQQTKRMLPWGLLLGIRPTKLAYQRLSAGDSKEKVINWLEKEKYVSADKAKLCVDIALKERTLLSKLAKDKGYSLFVSIPICPTICNYCSFSSGDLQRYEDRLDAYIKMLIKELRAVASKVKDQPLNTVYIGGGTPTVLPPRLLERLLEEIRDLFPAREVLEYTVEAGRPDAIDAEKLRLLKTYQVNRISINPQSMNQETLRLIGRAHTVEQIRESFTLARSLGFDNINMDIIAGFSNEKLADFDYTLAEIKKLQPDSLTVHSLAIKRAARLNEIKISADVVQEMVDSAREKASEMELFPYYLYRQKNSAGNFENIGYSRGGKESLYNILIMEELQTIIGCGAGAITKLVDREGKVRRVDNVKDIDTYIERIDEMIDKKGELQWF